MEIISKTYEEDEKGRELVLTVKAAAEEVDRALEDYFAELNKNEVPGFRKGKAPRTVLEQGVGGHEQAYTGAAELLVNTVGFKTIDDADIVFINEPEFNVDEIMEDGKPYIFTVSGQVPPMVELTSYEPVSIEMPPDEATDSEIDKHIENLREYYHTFEDITDPDHVAEMGDYVTMTLSCKNSDGSYIRGLTEVERLVGLGKGTMPIDFDEHIVGCKAGDTVAFDFDAASENMPADWGDGKLHAEVEVKGFRSCILPDLDDGFANKLGSANVETLRKAVADALNNDKRKYLPKLMEDRAVAALVERIKGEVPRYYVNFIGQDVSQEYIKKLEKEGTSLQEFILKNNIQRDDIREEIEAVAYQRAACDCALEALFAEKGWEVTQEEVDREFAALENGAEAQANWTKQHRLADFRKLIRQARSAKWLVDTAEVTVVEEDV